MVLHQKLMIYKNRMLLKTKLTSILILLFLIISPEGKAVKLSDRAEISILTCSPGNEMYSVYGHSAIRVLDHAYGYDMVFNYGIFDFNTPNFLYRFASGQTDYLLGAYAFDTFVKEYQRDKRSIFEQVLNLSQEEQQKIFDFLTWNAKPENRVYRYNFFFDNCATRVRDVIADQVEGGVIFPEKYGEQKTFRQLVKDYHGKLIWVNFGIDFVVSSDAEKVATVSEEMFLPDYLMKHFANAIKKKGKLPLVKSTNIVYVAEENDYKASKVSSPFVVFLIPTLLVLLLSVKQFRKNKLNHRLDYFVYGLNGVMGIIIAWFTLFSEHPAMSPNYNLFWAVPLSLVFVLLWKMKKWRSFLKYYHVLITGWLILFVVFGSMLPQKFHPVFYLFILMVLSRSIFHTITIFRPKGHVNKK